MKTNLKALVAAVALCVAGGAHASISDDNYSVGGIATGTGDGELFLAMLDPTQAKSIVVDLNLTANNFRNNNASLINTFSVADSGLQTFIGNSGDQSQILWNIGGISNDGLGAAPLGLLTTDGAGATHGQAVGNGGNMQVGMGNASAFASNNNFALGGTIATGGSAVSASNAPGTGWGSNYGDTFGGFLVNSNAGHLADQMLMSLIYGDFSSGDPQTMLDSATLVQDFLDGQWAVNAATGAVSYVAAGAPVPLPPALWLLGSSLAGVVAVARRRKDGSESVTDTVAA